jgi:hypothetical protein
MSLQPHIDWNEILDLNAGQRISFWSTSVTDATRELTVEDIKAAQQKVYNNGTWASADDPLYAAELARIQRRRQQ